jgi:hypothetical protein
MVAVQLCGVVLCEGLIYRTFEMVHGHSSWKTALIHLRCKIQGPVWSFQCYACECNNARPSVPLCFACTVKGVGPAESCNPTHDPSMSRCES